MIYPVLGILIVLERVQKTKYSNIAFLGQCLRVCAKPTSALGSKVCMVEFSNIMQHDDAK